MSFKSDFETFCKRKNWTKLSTDPQRALKKPSFRRVFLIPTINGNIANTRLGPEAIGPGQTRGPRLDDDALVSQRKYRSYSDIGFCATQTNVRRFDRSAYFKSSRQQPTACQIILRYSVPGTKSVNDPEIDTAFNCSMTVVGCNARETHCPIIMLFNRTGYYGESEYRTAKSERELSKCF